MTCWWCTGSGDNAEPDERPSAWRSGARGDGRTAALGAGAPRTSVTERWLSCSAEPHNTPNLCIAPALPRPHDPSKYAAAPPPSASCRRCSCRIPLEAPAGVHPRRVDPLPRRRTRWEPRGTSGRSGQSRRLPPPQPVLRSRVNSPRPGF